ncbi:MAG TPA: hypothetical protein VKY65_17600 [Alphaproteobacteria bacterium]|nr:hypothetical protein [Alphaproteobacteria bacterium]
MTTDSGEVPLVNMANVMLTVLKAAAAQPVSPGDCVERLLRTLRLVHENAEAQRSTLTERVALAVTELHAAALLAPRRDGRFAATERGRIVLAAHPLGVDETVLAEFREFRAFIRKHEAPAGDDKAELERTQAYLDGYGAYGAGRPLTENPHPAETAEHMDWDAGWCEALDDAIENTGVR